MYNRVNPAVKTEAQERFRRFMSRIASFPNSLAVAKPLPTRFRSRNVTNATSAAPSANHHTVNRVHHSENSRFETKSRQKLPGSTKTSTHDRRKRKPARVRTEDRAKEGTGCTGSGAKAGPRTKRDNTQDASGAQTYPGRTQRTAAEGNEKKANACEAAGERHAGPPRAGAYGRAAA